MRFSMGELCFNRWKSEKGAQVEALTEWLCACDAREFQRERRIAADEMADSDIYVVADDDCFLPADFDLDACLKIMNEHPEFAVLSLMHSNCNFSEWTPENYAVQSDSDVAEHYAAGGVRFCRKGVIKEWPPMGDGPGYDTIHGEAIRAAGYRIGYFRKHFDFHLGEGKSSVWIPDMVSA